VATKQRGYTNTTIYTVRPVVTEYHVRSVERSTRGTPLISKFLNFVSGLLACASFFVFVCWATGFESVAPSEVHDLVVGCVIWFVVAIVIRMISDWIAERAR
jgi:hypothetical protein